MRYITLIIFSFLLTGCKNGNREYPLDLHSPTEDIKQKIYDEDAFKFYEEGWNYSRQGNYKSAKLSFNKSLEIEKSPVTLNMLGWSEYTEKNYITAIKYYSQARALDSLYWPPYLNEARSHWKLKEYSEAENILLRLKDLCNSEYWIAYADYYLAIVYFNDQQGCEKVYEYIRKSKIIESDPNLRDAYKDIKNQIKKNCG